MKNRFFLIALTTIALIFLISCSEGIEPYRVNFDSQGGSSINSVDVAKGLRVGEPISPTRTGYVFLGWFKEKEGINKWNFTHDKVSSNITLYAKWATESYTITYDPNEATGGKAPDPQTKIHGTDLTVESNAGNLVRTDYTFLGWNTKADGSGVDYAPNAVYSIDASATLHAKWIKDNYIITYDANDATAGFVPNSQEKIHGVDLVVRANTGGLERTGYTFSGWNTKADGTGVGYSPGTSYSTDATTTLYAKWIANKYTVTFDPDGGTVSSPDKSVTYAQAYGALPSVTKTGHRFDGWYTEATGGGLKIESSTLVNIAGNHTLHAKWTKDDYTITYNSNSATKGTVPTSHKVPHGTEITVKANTGNLERLGYTFSGWNTKSDGSGTDYSPGASYCAEASATLYAKWIIDTFTIAYDSNGATSGSVPAAQEKKYNVNLVLSENSSNLVRTGYQFDGWNTKSDGSGTNYAVKASYTANADAILFAKWKVNQYEVTYETYGGTPSPAKRSVTYDQAYGSLPVVTKTGYSFSGWHTEANGAGFKIESDTVVKIAANHTLYAKWKAGKYDITYDANGATGGSVPAVQEKTHGENLVIQGNTGELVRTGYTFLKWNTKSDGSGTEYNSGAVYTNDEAVTLYAKWAARTDTAYKVEHYQQAVSGDDYTKVDTDSLSGTTGATATAGAKSYTGFRESKTHSSRVASGTIAADGSLVLKLYYDRETYTVSFDSGGGSTVSSITGVRYDAAITKPADPNRTGYTFASWNKQADLTDGWDFSNDKVTSNTTLYAKWAANEYEVTYEATGGTSSPTKSSVTYNQTYGTLASATKTGYTFDGWYTKADGAGSKVENSTVVNTASSHTLYAKWIANKYAVSFDPDGGTASSTEDKSVTFGQVYGTLPSATKVGHTLDGWYTKADGGGSKVESNTVVDTAYNHTLYAKWNINTYLVTFKDYDGKVLDTQKVNHGRYAIAPSDITRTGHTFTGWDRAFTNVTSDLTITAQYIINTYTVSFESNGGNVVSALTDVKYDSKITKPADPSKTGFTFVGWYKQARLTDEWDFSTDKIASDTILYAKWNAPLGPAGGYIFYDKGEYSDGWRYLEAAPAGWYIEIDPNWEGNDQSETELYDPRKPYGYYRPNGENELVGTNDGIGSGKANTDALVAAMGDEAYSAESGTEKSFYAAKTAKDYSGGGYSDWFLPSKDELDMMYENLYKQGLGGFRDGGAYWSSSEDSSGFAWYQGFSATGSNKIPRKNTVRVRPVRAF